MGSLPAAIVLVIFGFIGLLAAFSEKELKLFGVEMSAFVGRSATAVGCFSTALLCLAIWITLEATIDLDAASGAGSSTSSTTSTTTTTTTAVAGDSEDEPASPSTSSTTESSPPVDDRRSGDLPNNGQTDETEQENESEQETVQPRPRTSVCEPDSWRSYVDANYGAGVWRDGDSDCLHDAYEIGATGTAPDNADSDNDGLEDGLDPHTNTGGKLPSVEDQAVYFAD